MAEGFAAVGPPRPKYSDFNNQRPANTPWGDSEGEGQAEGEAVQVANAAAADEEEAAVEPLEEGELAVDLSFMEEEA